MNWTAEDLKAHYERLKTPQPTAEPAPAFSKPKRGMNKLEAAYAQELENQKRAGLISWWAFEPMKLRLATGAYYKPDFGVVTISRLHDGSFHFNLEFHETKGHWREAARVRIKVAAEHFPFKFVAITRSGGQWIREEF